ncbi:MAG: helix-turn-helix domain-containing protein [Acidimicrobiia bacterium]|nr:helix-turn-helix domain-containing protein [Acidimicrobiia bacterium]
MSPGSNRRGRFEVAVQPSFLHDVLIVLWSALGGDDGGANRELGRRWFDGIRRAVPSDLADQMYAFGGDSGTVWLSLIDWIASAPDPSDPHDTIEWLSSSDGPDRRKTALTDLCWDVDPSDLEMALAGDPDAIEACLARFEPEEREAVERWLTFPAESFASEVASVLARIISEVLPTEAKAWPDAHKRSAAAVEPLIGMMEPTDLIEQVTNGITFDIPLGVRRLVLIPSVSLKPWSLTIESGDTVYIHYPLADEHLDPDPAAPPQWLINFHKALGDERRLRMLRRIADGPVRLSELTETVGLAKSTVFHHIGILRSAGLIRVHVGSHGDGGPTYTLRREALGTAAEFTSQYLTGDRS